MNIFEDHISRSSFVIVHHSTLFHSCKKMKKCIFITLMISRPAEAKSDIPGVPPGPPPDLMAFDKEMDFDFDRRRGGGDVDVPGFEADIDLSRARIRGKKLCIFFFLT